MNAGALLMNDVIAFYVFNTRFESSASITQKGNINKASAEQEQRSAHGRVVKEYKPRA